MPHTSTPKTRKPPLRFPKAGAGGVAKHTQVTESAERSPGSWRPGASDGEPRACVFGMRQSSYGLGKPRRAGFLAVVEPPGRSSSTASSSSCNHPTLPAPPGLHLRGFEARAPAGAAAAVKATEAQARGGRPRPRPRPRPLGAAGAAGPPRSP